MNLEMTIMDTYIIFSKYPYRCATVYEKKKLSYEEILEFVENQAPPLFRTKGNELITVSAQYKEEILEFCTQNKVKVTHREDIWDMILEPFLDTEFSDEKKERIYTRLENYGFSRNACDDLRNELAPRMIAYNFESCLWDWCHLGFSDVLNASCGILSGNKHKLQDNEFEKFYKRATEIALLSFIEE